MANHKKIIVGVVVVLLLIIAFLIISKPSSAITGKSIDQIQENDVLVFGDKEYTLKNKTTNAENESLIDLGLIDAQSLPVSVTLNKTDIVPVKVKIDWYDLTPVQNITPTPNLPVPSPVTSPVPVTVPVPAPPNVSVNVTQPTPPNVSVPTPPNITTPPQPLPPNATPPTPPAPIPPNATTPPPPAPVPINITPPTPSPVHCTDSIWNGDESDLDCGGSCSKCLSSGMYTYCWDNNDCATGKCDRSIAQPLPPGYTISSLRALAGQAWIIPYQGQCKP
jgi:hypothetical protein